MESYTLEEKVLRKVMRNIPMGLIVSKEGFRRKIYYVNDTACEIMGYTREEYIRKMQDGWTDLMDVDLREVIREHNEQIRSGTPFEVLSRPQTKNGGYKWILSRVNVQMQEGPLCYVSFMDVTDRMEREELCRQENEVLREQAMQDSFTKLLNRGALEKHVCEALQERGGDEEDAFILLDVDNFKQINDIYGHGVGDMILMRMAGILNEVFGDHSCIGRMGGDEFAAMLFFGKNIPDKAIMERAQQIFDKVNLTVKSTEGCSGISMGAVIAKTEVTFNQLYEESDNALYSAKEKGRGRIVVVWHGQKA